MRMRFDQETDGDEDAFFVRRDELGEEFAQWLTTHEVPGDPNDAGLLMDWKWGYSDGALDAWTVHDVSEFLFDWCVRKLSASPQDAAEIPGSVTAFVEFLAHRGLLAPGAVPPSRIRAYCEEITQDFVREMGNPANFGMAKSLFGGDLPDLAGIPADQEPVVIGPVRLPSDEERLAAIRDAPITRWVRELAAYCTSPGRSLTTKGNLRLADARQLVEMLDTGDDLESPLRSAEDLPVLARVVDLALEAGAVRRQKGRLLEVARFAALDDPTVHERLVRAAIGGDEERGLGPGMLLALLQIGAGGCSVEQLVETMVDTSPLNALLPGYLSGMLRLYAVDDLLQLARLGLLTVDGLQTSPHHGEPHRDGHVTISAAGVLVAVELAADAGVEVVPWPDPHTADAAAIADLVGAVDQEEWVADTRTWLGVQPDAVSAGHALVAAIAAERRPPVAVLSGFEAVEEVLGDETIDAVRAQLDGPHDGVVLHWLITHSALDPSTVDPARVLRGTVDVLAAVLDTGDPDDILAVLSPGEPAEHLELLDRIWRVPHPALPQVLETIGAHHPVKAVAKAARKALMRHRSLLASGNGQ